MFQFYSYKLKSAQKKVLRNVQKWQNKKIFFLSRMHILFLEDQKKFQNVLVIFK